MSFTNYTYDSVGNRTAITDANGSHTFSYDALDRLTAASHAGTSSLPIKSEAFSFDPIGNRLSDTARSGYAYDAANRIEGDSSFTYTSDANGNVTSRTNRTTHETTFFIYDSDNNLVRVNGPSGTIASYKYDVLGNRVETNVGGTVTRFIYDGARILAILDGNNNLIALFTNGPGIDSPLIMRKGGLDYFYHADALANVDALTDGSGNIVETYEYQAFGRAVVKDAQGGFHEQSTVGNPFMYSSRELDPETGLIYLRARHYDPDTGRFMQEDPIPSVNQYTYADNSPILYADPLGLQPTENPILNFFGGLGYGASFGLTGTQGGFYKRCTTAFKVGSAIGNFAIWSAIFGGVGKMFTLAKRAGTIWDFIKPTQEVWTGTVLPRSFTISTEAGEFWVSGSATKHMAEYAASGVKSGLSSELVNMNTQMQLSSLRAAIQQATVQGFKYGEPVTTGGWELIFAPPRRAGYFTEIYHALMK